MRATDVFESRSLSYRRDVLQTPQGVKRNLERTYNGLDTTISSVENAKIVFVLAWFHAIVQERRTFIPQGWQKFYEFSDADFQMALKVIERMVVNGNCQLSTIVS